jgi:hypothetical protein
MLAFDPRKLLGEIRSLPTHQGLDAVRGPLATLFTYDLSPVIDRICAEKLGIPRPKQDVSVGVQK